MGRPPSRGHRRVCATPGHLWYSGPREDALDTDPDRVPGALAGAGGAVRAALRPPEHLPRRRVLRRTPGDHGSPGEEHPGSCQFCRTSQRSRTLAPVAGVEITAPPAIAGREAIDASAQQTSVDRSPHAARALLCDSSDPFLRRSDRRHVARIAALRRGFRHACPARSQLCASLSYPSFFSAAPPSPRPAPTMNTLTTTVTKTTRRTRPSSSRRRRSSTSATSSPRRRDPRPAADRRRHGHDHR